jgi:hypothetical protein
MIDAFALLQMLIIIRQIGVRHQDIVVEANEFYRTHCRAKQRGKEQGAYKESF